MPRSLTLVEEYYIPLDGDDFTIPPVEMGNIEIVWHEDHFDLVNNINVDMAEMFEVTGAPAEQAHLMNLVYRYMQLLTLVLMTNRLINASKDNPRYADTFATPDGMHYWAYHAMLWTCDLVDLTVIGVDEDTRTFALAAA